MAEYRTKKTIRLKNYDYSKVGAYFITVCTYNREHLFGHITVGADAPVRPSIAPAHPCVDTHVHPHIATPAPTPKMVKSEIGQIINDCWDNINHVHENVRTDMFCIMPNHIHGIIIIGDTGGQVETDGRVENMDGHVKNMGGQSRPPLQKVVQGFKSITTRMCFPMGYQKIWQRSYHDHIIRNELEYKRIWEYIDANPFKWETDNYYNPR